MKKPSEIVEAGFERRERGLRNDTFGQAQKIANTRAAMGRLCDELYYSGVLSVEAISNITGVPVSDIVLEGERKRA